MDKDLDEERYECGKVLSSPQVANWESGGMRSSSKYFSWWRILHCQSVYGFWLVWIIYCIVTNPVHDYFSNNISFYNQYIITSVNILED